MWFHLGRNLDKPCATEGCLNGSEWRLEAGGTGSDYCVNCKSIIEEQERQWIEEANQEQERQYLESLEIEEHFRRHPHG